MLRLLYVVATTCMDGNAPAWTVVRLTFCTPSISANRVNVERL